MARLEKNIEKKLIRSFSEETDVIVIGNTLTWMLDHPTASENLSESQKEFLSNFKHEFYITDDYHSFDFIMDDTRYVLEGTGSVSVYSVDEYLSIRDLLVLEEFEDEGVYITDFKGEIYAQIRDFDSDEVLTFSESETEDYLMHLVDRKNSDESDEVIGEYMDTYVALSIGEYSEIETFVIDLDEEIEVD